jgi:hypothetical protein
MQPLRAPPVLSYDPVSLHVARFYFLFPRTRCELFTRNHARLPFSVTSTAGHGELGPLSPLGGPTAPFARLTSRTSTPQGCGAVVTPVVIDQCQQPTILFSRNGNPSSRFTPLRASLRVTVAHGSHRFFEPAPVNMSAYREDCLLAPHRHAFRACFVAPRVRGRTLTLDDRSPPPRYCVHRRAR